MRALPGGGIKTCAAAATVEQLTETSIKCRMVLVEPRYTDPGVAQNTQVCRVGPSLTEQDVQILPSSEGKWYPCEDASEVFLKVTVNGEGVRWTPFN